MSQTTKKMMSLELEFIDTTAHGFINWIDAISGDSLATLGLGETAMDSDGNDTGGSKFLEWNLEGVDYIKITGGGIQFDEQRSLSIDGERDIITIDEYGNEIITPTAYVPSQIQLNAADYTDIEKASVIYPYVEPVLDENNIPVEQPQSDGWTNLNNVKVEYADNTNAMIFEHEHAIAFSNPVSNRLMGEIDMVNEAFVWYGAFSLGSVVEDSMFEIKRTNPEKYNFSINADVDNKPEIAFKKEDVVVWSMSVDTNLILKDINGNGLEISDTATTFTGEIIYQGQPLIDYFYEKTALDDGVLDTRYYIKSEVDSLISDAEERIKEDIRLEFLPKIEEVADLASGLPIYYTYDTDWIKVEYTTIDEEYDLPNSAEVNSIYYAELEDTFHIYDTTFTQMTTIDVNNKSFPRVFEVGDYYGVSVLSNIDVYEWDGSGWNNTALDEVDVYTEIDHKSDIVNDGVYKVTSTGKYYEMSGELIKIDNPLPVVSNVMSLPDQFNPMMMIVKNVFI
jgi:hypothetical protein